MTVLAAAAVGVCCATLVGALYGALPTRAAFRRPPPRTVRAGSAAWLREAGVRATPVQFFAASAFAAGLALVALVALTGSLFVAVVPSGATALLPVAFFGRRRRQRARAVQEAWPDGLRDLVASISSGRSLTQSVIALAEHGPEPLRVAFARLGDLARVLGTSAALDVVREELADPTSDRVIEVLVLANERGGAIVRTILDDLVESTSLDVKLLDELDTEGLEMRINARAVVVLPWLVLVALTARAGPFRDFYRSGGGVATIAVAGLLSGLGVALLSRLGREPIEPRVLGARGVS